MKFKKRFFTLFLVLGFSAFHFVEAAEDSSSVKWYYSEKIFDAIGKQLSNISLDPFLKGKGKGNAEIRLLGVDTSLNLPLNADIAFLAGTLSYEDMVFNIMLSAKRNPVSKDVGVSLLYLSKGEARPTAQLCLDVSHYIQSAPQFSKMVSQFDLGETPVFIEKTEKRREFIFPINGIRHVASEARYEKWTFFKLGITAEFYVFSVPVRGGGVDFVVVPL